MFFIPLIPVKGVGELEQHATEFARISEGREGVQEGCELMRCALGDTVGESLVCLHEEEEPAGGFQGKGGHEVGLGNAVEGGIELDGAEFSGVKIEEIPLRESLWIERSYPVIVTIAARSYIEHPCPPGASSSAGKQGELFLRSCVEFTSFIHECAIAGTAKLWTTHMRKPAKEELRFLLLFLLVLLPGGCSDPIPPPPPVSCEVAPYVDPRGLSLYFIVDPDERGGRGYYWEGANWGTAAEELAGRAELIKEDGWLRVGETWSYNGSTDTYEKSLFGAFAGVALNIFEPVSSEPFVSFPVDLGSAWYSDTVFQTCPDQEEVERYFTYSVSDVGTVDLLESGSPVRTFEDVVMYRATANEGTDSLAVWLAPNVGIVYSIYTVCEITSLAALIGYNVRNEDFNTGESITDYFPMAPCAIWYYEFSKDYESGDPIDFRLSLAVRP